MKFSLRNSGLILALCLTQSLPIFADLEGGSLRIPLHKRSHSHNQDRIPVCDFEQLDRRVVKIEGRYSPNQDDPKVINNRKKFQEKWVGNSQSIKSDLSARAGKVGIDKLSNQDDMEYFATVKVGTPGQTFKVVPDSGSADFWVVSQKCQSKNCSTKKHKFDSKESKTFQAKGNKDFYISYGIGGASGSFFRDTFEMAGIKIQNQTIAQATKISSDHLRDRTEGVMGLGWRSLTTGREIPVIQRLFDQHQFKDKVVAFAFGAASRGTEDKAEMSLGSVNKDLFKGEIHYTPLTSLDFWRINMDSFFTGGTEGVRDISVIIDTGTTVIHMPEDKARDFHKGVEGSKYRKNGYFVFPCSQSVKATFKMTDGTSFKLNSKDLNLGRESEGSSFCVSAVLPSETGGIVVFGLTLLRNVYTIFDYGNKRIGFAVYNF